MNDKLLVYYQDVLERISMADATVFRKELRKAFKRLTPEQRLDLKAWFRSNCACRVERLAGSGVVLNEFSNLRKNGQLK